MTQDPPEASRDLKSLVTRKWGLRAAPRPGSYANRGDVPAASSHPEGGHSGHLAPPFPPPQAKETEDQRLKGNSSAVRAGFPPGGGAPSLPAGRGSRSSAASRAPRAGARAASCSPRNHRARAQGAAHGWGTFRGRKWPRECRREGEAGSRESPGERAG